MTEYLIRKTSGDFMNRHKPCYGCTEHEYFCEFYGIKSYYYTRECDPLEIAKEVGDPVIVHVRNPSVKSMPWDGPVLEIYDSYRE